MSPTLIFNSLFATFVAMTTSLPGLPAEIIKYIFDFIPRKEHAIISVRETCKALALKTTEIFAREYFPSGSWRLTRRAVSAITGISKNEFLNPTLKRITLFRYVNQYEESNSRYSLAKGIDIKELCQGLQTLANLRSLCLANFDVPGSENFLGDLLATLSLPSITEFKLSNIVAHADDLRKFIALHSDIIKTVEFDELDLTAPARGAWSGLLSSLTQLKDVELILIRKPLKCDNFVRFESKDENKSIFKRYVWMDTYYDGCDCNYCLDHSGQNYHLVFDEYRLGTDTKKEDWTRGLELMMAGSRTVRFRWDNNPIDAHPDP